MHDAPEGQSGNEEFLGTLDVCCIYFVGCFPLCFHFLDQHEVLVFKVLECFRGGSGVYWPHGNCFWLIFSYCSLVRLLLFLRSLFKTCFSHNLF